jgi:hypothetical protein
MKVKVLDHDDLVRDINTKAVLNSDLSSLQQYKARRAKEWQKESEMQEMKKEISELKALIQLLVEKNK